MVDNELRNELRGAGLEPTAEFRARMDQEFDDALAGRRVLTVAAPVTGTDRRAGWMWPVLGSAAALIAVAVVVFNATDSDRDGFSATTELTTGSTSASTEPSTVTTPVADDPQMEVLKATLFGLQVGDMVDVTATIARIDAMSFGPHTFDSGWYRVPDDPSIDSCYDDMDYRGVMWGDALVIFNGSDSSAEVMSWTVGEQSPQTATFFLGTDLPVPQRSNDIVSAEGVRIGGDESEVQTAGFTKLGDRIDGETVYSVNGLPSQGNGALPQPLVYVTVKDGKVVSVLADVGRC